jgi:taurine dioxygenase
MTTPEAHPLHPALGAEITGLDVTRRLTEAERRFLQEAFDRFGLVLIRDVELDRPRQAYLSEMLRTGVEPGEDDAAAIAEKQSGFWISNKMDDAAAPFGSLLFHADSMWSEFPFDVISLYGVEVQPPVTPTRFASATNTWEILPDDLKDTIRDLEAVNVSGPEYVPKRRTANFDDLLQGHRDQIPSFTWPVVRAHPRTGQPVLYMCQANTQRLVGYDEDASEDVIERVFDVFYAPEHVFEHEWLTNDLVVWDNWSVQHARSDVALEGPVRTLRKIGLPIVEASIATAIIDTYVTVEHTA